MMSKEIINNLLEAINVSPENVPLRLQVAGMMMKEQMYAEAGEQYQEVLGKNYGNVNAQLGLAACYYHQQKYSAAIFIYEQLQKGMTPPDQLLFIKSLIKENSIRQAVDIYQQLLALHPEFKDEEIDTYLRIPNS